MPLRLVENWQDRERWDKFVDGHGQGRFCQLYAYGDVVSCYGYRPVRLAFLRDGELAAVLPAALVKSVLFGCKLVSQPFSEYGGLLADPNLAPAEMAEIHALLQEHLVRNRKIKAIELHGNHGIPPNLRDGPLIEQNPHHVAILALDRPADEIWQKVVQYSVRKGVNKAAAQGVTAFEECSESVIRERFYPLYLKSMKRLGVPPHSLDYYLRSQELFGGRLKIFWAAREDAILSGLLGFVCGGRVNIVNIVSDPDSWKFAPNDLIHWEFVKWAAESGLKFFDFGSVRYDGQRTYKKKWGTVFEDHAYYFLARDSARLSRTTFNSSSPGMTRMAELWSGHVPDLVAQLVGPVIRKHLVR
jgi:lipid II:glycine glycyltransferase (peptidoglycan interpeptide bridge formation enzyme)